jgi:hypothetical protein
VLSHTHSLMCESEKAHELQSPQVWPDRPAFPARLVLTVSFVLFPVIGFFVTVASRDEPAKRNASVEASEPHDFAVRELRHSSVDGIASIASRTQRS